MKLFKKVLAVVLVGAMAVSMLTACGSSKSSKVKDALKDFDIKMDSAMVQDTEKMMGGLQEATAKVTSGAINLTDGTGVDAVVTELNKMTDYSFTTGSDKKYDLYIWTNGADGKPGGGNYPYLYRVDPIHVTKENLSRLMAKDFVQKGVFDGSDATLATLKSVLDGAKLNDQKVTNVGISCQKVYGMDVLLVTVPHGASVPQTTKSST